MSFQDELKQLFVEENEIPEEFRISEIHQREYLVNGEMKQWTGPVSEVYAPINIPTAEGLKRKLIGTYPLGTEKEAFEALDAVKEFDRTIEYINATIDALKEIDDALRSFSIRSLVATKMNDTNKKLLEDIVNGHRSEFLSTNFIF